MVLVCLGLVAICGAAELGAPRWMRDGAKAVLPNPALVIEYRETEPGGRVRMFRVDGRGNGRRAIVGEASSVRRVRVNPRDVQALFRVIALEHRFLTRGPVVAPPADETLPARLSVQIGEHRVVYRGRAKPDAGPKSSGLSLVRFRLRVMLPDASER
ncbi:MAG: hypothetical protein KC609_00215 [Myxococcales bacterium]|nr:hypothetical protein [Myxococcales bacterium]